MFRPALFYFGTHDTGFALPDASDLKLAKKKPLLKKAYDEASEWTST